MIPPTIRDVARAAGVGVGTVSRVLNNRPRVSQETREHVLAVIQEIGFRPNKAAVRLSSAKQIGSVGVVLPYLTNYSFTERLRGVQMALGDNDENWELVLYSVSSLKSYEEQIILITEHRMVEGVLVVALNIPPEYRQMLEKARIAYVGINDRCTDEWPCIGLDNIAGGYIATEYLVKHGHTRVAYVGDRFPDNYGFPTSEDRHNGYIQALIHYGIAPNPDYVRLDEHGRDTAQTLTTELLNLPEPPSAIFAMSDFQALGCLAAISEAGQRVPDDISVIGFDDIEISRYIGLTTVRQHLEDSGRLGMQSLLSLIDGTAPPTPVQLQPLEIIARQTVRHYQ